MRRVLLFTMLGGVTALAATGIMLSPVYSTAQSGGSGPAVPAAKPPAQLPVAQVVLFSSGVGYFQREGEVEGNSRIDLTFPVENINDLLKSLVLQDLGGGHISTVSYDSHDPIDKTLRSFAINLTNNPTFGQVLQQARGEKVEVVMQQTATSQPGTLSGVVMGVEHQRQPVGRDGAVEVDMLNLLCSEGMRSCKLADVQRVRFLNPVIDNELKRALDVLALSHDTQKKAVSLSFNGQGKRPVRVGYVVETPIWKTSHRLVLGKNGKPFLQGWAVVENPSDEDWNNVRMALISGRPISFQMDLYQPLYVPRPVVEPELFASLRPPTYTGAMSSDKDAPAKMPPPAAAHAPAERLSESEEFHRDKGKKESRLGAVNGSLDGAASYKARERAYAVELGLALGKELDLKSGVASAATAREMGDFFQYIIEHPVTLPRQKSAMLPIVNQNVEGTRVSIYNQGVHAKFPLLGLKFKNTSGLHLMQGPVTVFEGSNYAGDARVMDLQPNEERLISYAIDLGTEVEPVMNPTPDRITAIKLVKGILHHTHKLRESRTFNIKNRTEHDRTLIIEHPYRPDFNLVTPEKPSERSRDVYRFEVSVPAGKTAKQDIIEERDLVHQVALSNSDDQTIRFFMNSAVSSPKVKEALQKALAFKDQLSSTQRDLANVNKQLADITADQTRLRANLREMPPSAAAYKRYLEKFDKQETEIEHFQDQIKKLQQAEHQQRKDYDAYLTGLTID